MMSTDSHSPSEIREILRMKNVAVVGMSNTDGKPANFVPKYLIENGYNVIPVNPTTKEVLGGKSYASISDIQHIKEKGLDTTGLEKHYLYCRHLVYCLLSESNSLPLYLVYNSSNLATFSF